MDQYNLVVLDFEFLTINRSDMVLISGALSNVYLEARTIKLKGRPLVITKNPKTVSNITEHQKRKTLRSIFRIFKDREDLMYPIINELQESLTAKYSNLTVEYINKYLNFNNKTPIVITWNGQSDHNILRDLNINLRTIILSAYDKFNNKNFFLRANFIGEKEIITEIEIGYNEKRGRLLNLMEAHSMVCNINHNSTYVHDPVTDVKMTKCIYHFINNNSRIQFI